MLSRKYYFLKKHYLKITCLILVFILSCKVNLKGNKDVVLYKYGNAQTEIISPKGVRIIIDLYDSTQLTSTLKKNDILLITHNHPDHVSGDSNHFKKIINFSGKKILWEEREIKKKDVYIRSFACTHYPDKKNLKKGGSNYIFLIVIGKIKIAHFGDIHQKKFTTEQLEKFNDIDIAITQFDNFISGMNFDNKDGFKLMDQLKPKIIIPSHNHISKSSANYAINKWDPYYNENPLIIKEDILKGKTKILFLGKKLIHLINETSDTKKLN